MEAVGEGTRADITMTSEVARELAVKTVEMYRKGQSNMPFDSTITLPRLRLGRALAGQRPGV